jgi:GT2 family glycosyltransferase
MLGTDRSAIPKATAAILESPTRDHSIREQEWNTAPNLPLVSIIIPVFNGAQFLSDAVENVRSQAYPAIELIVVDDGSTDAIEETINNLPLEVRLLRQSNRGPAAARNLGIKNATGDLLAFLDVDDLWPENNLYMLVRHLLENTQLQLVRGHAQIMQLEAHNNEYRLIGNPLESFPDYIGAALYRKSLFQAVGLFDQTRFFGEDSDWFERVDQSGEAMQTLDLVTLHVRRHGGNMTENKPLATMRKLQLVKKHLEARREPAS